MGESLLTKIYLFQSSLAFFPSASFLLLILFQGTTLLLVTHFLRSVMVFTVSEIFLEFNELDSFVDAT